MLLTGLLVFFAQADIVRYLPRYSVKLKGGVDQARALSKARFVYVPSHKKAET